MHAPARPTAIRIANGAERAVERAVHQLGEPRLRDPSRPRGAEGVRIAARYPVIEDQPTGTQVPQERVVAERPGCEPEPTGAAEQRDDAGHRGRRKPTPRRATRGRRIGGWMVRPIRDVHGHAYGFGAHLRDLRKFRARPSGGYPAQKTLKTWIAAGSSTTTKMAGKMQTASGKSILIGAFCDIS